MISLKKSTKMAVALFIGPTLALAGETSGGGLPEKIDLAAIEMLLKEGALKNAMLNYLKTIQVEKIKPAKVRALFTELTKNDQLKMDIETPDNYYIKDGCRDDHEKDVKKSEELAAKAIIGDVGGKICFDAKALAKQYQDLSSEEGMIRLAALAFHEHAHHFQKDTDPIKDNEDAAYAFAAYIKLTARMATLPVLKWAPDEPMAMDCMKIRGMYVLNENSIPPMGDTRFSFSISKYYNIFTRSASQIRIVTDQSEYQYPFPPINDYTFDNKLHLVTNEMRPNPKNNYREEYMAYCTSNGFVLSELSSDHTGAEGNPIVGYYKRKSEFTFSGDTLSVTHTNTSYDLQMRPEWNVQFPLKYQLEKK